MKKKKSQKESILEWIWFFVAVVVNFSKDVTLKDSIS